MKAWMGSEQAADFCAIADGVEGVADAFGIANRQTVDAQSLAVAGQVVDGAGADGEDNGVTRHGDREVEMEDVDALIGDVEDRRIWIEAHPVLHELLVIVFDEIRVGAFGEFGHVDDGDFVAVFSEFGSDLHADETAADDGHALADLGTVHEHIIALDDIDMRQAGTVRQCLWHGAGGEDDGIWLHGLEKGAVNGGVQKDLGTGSFEEAAFGRDEGAVVGLFSAVAGNDPLAAEFAGFFGKGDIVAAFGEGSGCFHAGESAAADEDFLWCLRWDEVVKSVFTQVAWVDGAGALGWDDLLAGAFGVAVEAADAG